MLDEQKVVVIVPARKGSKGLPGKNRLKVGGLSLVEWALHSAFGIDGVGVVCFSSDDELLINEIADMQFGCGKEVPFVLDKRPPELAADDTSALVLLRYLTRTALGDIVDDNTILVLLEPTSPMRSLCDLNAAIQCFKESSSDCLVSLCAIDKNPYNVYILPEDGGESDNAERFVRVQSTPYQKQQFKNYGRVTGNFYLFKVRHLKNDKLITDTISYFLQDRVYSLNIDSHIDYLFAKFLFSHQPDLWQR